MFYVLVGLICLFLGYLAGTIDVGKKPEAVNIEYFDHEVKAGDIVYTESGYFAKVILVADYYWKNVYGYEYYMAIVERVDKDALADKSKNSAAPGV